MKKCVTVLILVFCSSYAYADCTHDGVSYPSGTTLGPLVCSPDGAWQPR